MKSLSQALQAALDTTDFERIAAYMDKTQWDVADLHDGRGPDNHRRYIPNAEELRRYVVRQSSCYLSAANTPCGWYGLGFDVMLLEKGGDLHVRIRFTDPRPILVES